MNQCLVWCLINFVLKTIELGGGYGVLICLLSFSLVLKFEHCLKNNRVMVFIVGV
jgi:hypothetical protein